jgi:hypothetical protein
MKIIHGCIRDGHIVDWKWDWWLTRFGWELHYGMFQLHFGLRLFPWWHCKVSLLLKVWSWGCEWDFVAVIETPLELSVLTKLKFWGLIVVSSDRGGWGDHSGPFFMSIRGWGEELWTIYCWETVGEYLNPSGVGSIVKLWLFWRVCGQFRWRKVRGFCAVAVSIWLICDEICWNFDMNYWYELEVGKEHAWLLFDWFIAWVRSSYNLLLNTSAEERGSCCNVT